MFCFRCKATISTASCLKRQEMAKTEKIKYIESLLNCIDCPQGKKLLKTNKTYLNRDINTLKQEFSNTEKEKQNGK